MRLLSAIQGKSGEALSSAVLAYLLIRSPDSRRVFLEYISDIAGLPPPTNGQRFSVEMEVRTRDGRQEEIDVDAGKIDLLIESDNCVIGIENKLFAPFQPNQPHNYWSHVEQSAVQLTSRYGRPFLPKLIVLAPESKKNEVVLDARITFVSWVAVLDHLLAEVRTGDGVASEILQELDAFVRPQLDFFTTFATKLERLGCSLSPSANETQREMIRALWSVFRPDSLFAEAAFHPRGTADSWYGVNFLTRGRTAVAWYGFVNWRAGRETERASFVLALDRDQFTDVALAEPFERLPDIDNWNNDLWSAWKVRLNQVKTAEVWRNLISPVHKLIAQLPEAERAALGYGENLPNP